MIEGHLVETAECVGDLIAEAMAGQRCYAAPSRNS